MLPLLRAYEPPAFLRHPLHPHLSSDTTMLRHVAATVRRSVPGAFRRAPLRRLSSRAGSAGAAGAASYVPLATVSACAATSAAMYYYFMGRATVKNESPAAVGEAGASGEPEIEVVEIVEEPVEVVEVVEVVEEPGEAGAGSEGAAGDLEAEAQREGAFNEETGEINWECPCLGGMAHGPCGEDFKAAFSCFVYSSQEPKGIECIDKFKNMQDCFRKYPEVYSEELRDEDAVEREVVQTERAVDQAVMNNDIIESVQDAAQEAREIKDNVARLAYDIYGEAQKKIDDFSKK